VLLDAALECVLAVGVRRTTLSDVARTAGVSRMTLYRRFPDVRGMLSALLTREFGKLIVEVTEAGVNEPTARGQLIAASVHTLRALSNNSLMRTLIERDAEMLLPYLTERIGTSQRMSEEFIRAKLAAGVEDGSIRAGDPAVQARMVYLLLQPYVITSRPSTSDLTLDDLVAEVGRVLDLALRP
jgi:AcrR family transcriptional regulator